MQIRSKIAPCLWFDSQAEEAAKFYTGIFGNSKIVATSRYGEAGKEVHGRKPDPAKSARAMQAMLRMKKLDIAALQQAFNANPS